MISRTSRVAAALAGAALVTFAAPGSASAHIGVDKGEIAAGASAQVAFSFSHGCGDSPTRSMRFQIPESITNAVPQVHAGWDISIEKAALATPVSVAHGEPRTERNAVITFTAKAGNEVPNGHRDSVVLSFTAPTTPGTLYFKVVQGCVTGENPWITEWDGTGTEPENPAPTVKVVEAADSATTVAVGGTDDDGDDDGGDALGYAGAGLGAAGLAVGCIALARTRRAR